MADERKRQILRMFMGMGMRGSRDEHDLDEDDPRGFSMDHARMMMMRERGMVSGFRGYRNEEDEYRSRMRRGPRGLRRNSSDEESPERGREFSSSMRPQFCLRQNREYINIMKLFDKNAAYLRRKG